MTRCAHAFQWMVLAALAASSVACGNSMSTTGPSGVSGGSGGGAVISGRVTMSGSGASSVSARAPLALAVLPMAVAVPRAGGAAADAGSVTVTIVGTGVSTTLDGSGSFTLDNVPPGTVTLNFKGRGADAMLTISGIEADDRISIAVTLNGSSARLDKSEKTGGGGNGNGNLVNGRIDSIDNGARSFRVDAQTVFVPQGTTIRHGNRTFQFTDLRVGDHVQVKGTRNGSMVTASEIKVEQGGDDDDDDDDVDRTTFRGSVSLLTGLCPGLTLTVAGTRVVTNAATQFDDVTCATLRNEMIVEVTGIRRSDGSFLATEIDREDSDTTEVRGTVSLLIGLCPGLTFTAAGTQIVTNAATQFEDVTCATLTNTMLVEVQGLRRSDGSILASKIDRD